MDNIIENFKFLAIEAENQVKLTYGLLNDFQPELLEKIVAKDDYIDNLKTTVENACFSQLYSGWSDREMVNDIQAVHIICLNLERVADFCVNIGRQLHYLTETAFIRKYDYRSMFEEIQKALQMVTRVYDDRNLVEALRICRAEFHLDRLYKENFDQMLAELKKGRHVTDLVTSIFIFRYLERIGDAILNIGEALIFATIGDRIKIRQFNALQETLSKSGFEGTLSDIDFTSIWGSRSGCRIGKVNREKPSGFKAQGIFKEGIIRKIRQERDNIQKWEKLFPGLAPEIFGYHEKGEKASLLVEFLTGCTLDQIILTETSDMIRNVIFIFENTVNDVWSGTLKRKPLATDFMDQLQKRLEGVMRVHPNLRRSAGGIGGLVIPSSEELIQRCAAIEKNIAAPFRIFIHGDFNTNNIVYNHADQMMNYIDLYRSKEGDYVQDASVFLVSHFRLPVFDVELRERLNTVTLYFWEFFAEFAAQNEDSLFQIRMALALARSFYTSTRFELNYPFALEMYRRALYIMENIVAHEGRPWEDFVLPQSVLFY